MQDKLSTSDHAAALGNLLLDKLNEFCPTETLKISPRDKACVNSELKTLDRRKQREYQKRGKSEKYDKLAKQFETKYKAAAEKYLKRKVDALKEVKPGSACYKLPQLV